MSQTAPDDLLSAAAVVRSACHNQQYSTPEVGVILGSGLGSAAEVLRQRGGLAIPYADLPGMPQTHVVGHTGRLVLGNIGGQTAVMLQGRVHSYEGHSLDAVLFGTRLLAELGIRTLIVTNAAGGIRSSLVPGSLMLIRSHLRPLAALYPAFSQLSRTTGGVPSHSVSRNLWCSRLMMMAQSIPTPMSVQDGVYAMMTGPCYETPAEIRMLRSLGADAVGMSTVPEALEAACHGIEVLGVSCITNVAAGLSENSLNHAEVTATASAVETEFVTWLFELLHRLRPSP